MGTKTVSLKLEAWERLRRARRTPGESFSDVVMRARWEAVTVTGGELLRMVRERGPLYDAAGLAKVEAVKAEEAPRGQTAGTMILETTFLIDLEHELAKGRPGPAQRFLEAHAAEPLRITFTVAGELAAGLPTTEWARWERFVEVNVDGTAHVVSGAASCGRVVHVSTPSVAFHDHAAMGAGPEAPRYTGRDGYARSKAIAERMVLRTSLVPTVVLRPHLVWGPGETQLVGRP